MTRKIFLPLAFLALAACSQQAEDPSEPAGEQTARPVEADGGIGDGAVAPAPVVTEEIPQAFLGVWDYVEGNCDPASDLRVEISPRSMQFYESHGEVTRAEVDSPRRIVVSLAMEGEGEKWQMARMFTLSDDGKTLTPESVDEEQFEPMPLKKCE